MLNYSVICSNNRDVKVTFFLQAIYSFSKENVEGIFLNCSNYVLSLAEFKAKIPCFSLFMSRL